MTQEQAANWINNDKKLYLMDVREPNEYEQGHIENSILIPLSVLKIMPNANCEKTAYLNQLPSNKEQKILCYCRRGGRSLQATDILRHAGFANTFSMDGGYEAWTEKNKKSTGPRSPGCCLLQPGLSFQLDLEFHKHGTRVDLLSKLFPESQSILILACHFGADIINMVPAAIAHN